MSGDSRIRFTKPALSVEQQLEKLRGRGLVLLPEHKAEHYLMHIGYYRMTGYFRFFQSGPDHTFRPGTTFEDALKLYVFDRELRLLVMDGLERIEVAVRTVISNLMCERHGAHWFMEERHFGPDYDHKGLLGTIKTETGLGNRARRNPITKHYFLKYKEPELPPSWMIAEVLSLGTWSKIYSNLVSIEDRRPVAARFRTTPPVLESWLRALTYIRNICAHHQLLWNRSLTISPMKVYIGPATLADANRFYSMAALIEKLMQLVSPNSAWAMRLFDLIARYPGVPVTAMGFPTDWATKPFWADAINAGRQQAQQAKASAS